MRSARFQRRCALEPDNISFLGNPNGANLLGTVLRLHPGVIHRGILLRGIEVLEDPPAAQLTGTRVLLLTGANDPFAPMVSALERGLTVAGAEFGATGSTGGTNFRRMTARSPLTG